jgi:NAD(P)-dependent dehydrogenase (short-subunit alcohol dehydrogenase family)
VNRRTVLITGGANGLGAALARHFSAAADQVAIADTDDEAGGRLAQDIGGLFVHTDVSVFADNQTAVSAVVDRFGGLDAVCLNAGVPGGTGIGEQFDPKRYRHSMGINLDGVVYGVNAALPHLRKRDSGAIMITSSLAGIAPSLDLYYSAAKHALVGLTRSLAMCLHHDSITVNAICPGFVDTAIIANIRDALTKNGIAVANPAHIAAEAATILESPTTGQVWEVQADKPATPITFPNITLSRHPTADPPDPCH